MDSFPNDPGQDGFGINIVKIRFNHYVASLDSVSLRLDQVLGLWIQKVKRWSRDGSLLLAARHALRLADEPSLLGGLSAQWQAGDTSSLPAVELLEATALAGAFGAYAASTKTIYLNRAWMSTASEADVVAVLTEELGHHLDALLNSTDTPGDEGQLFSSLLLSADGLPSAQRQAVLTENDHSTLFHQGQFLAIEQSLGDTQVPLLRITPNLTYNFPQGRLADFKIGLLRAQDNVGVASINLISGNDAGYFATTLSTEYPPTVVSGQTFSTFSLVLTAAGAAATAASNSLDVLPNTFELGLQASDAAGNLSLIGKVTVNVTDDRIQEKIGGATSATTSEIPAYDPASKRLYVVAGSVVDIYTITETGALTAVGQLSPGFVPASGTAAPNSVAIKNGIVAVAYEVKDVASGTHQPGKVGFYQASNGAFLSSADVGYLPDMLTFTADGLKVLVANEGEPNEDYSVDPEGSVSIIDLSSGVANATAQQVGFSAYNSQDIALKSQGVRIFGRLKDGTASTVAQDLEPEYIAVSPDGLTAAITLQENNAVAILDLATATISSIKPLGYKNHSLAGQGLDASDRDVNGTSAGGGKINIANWPVFGMFQPDGIASFSAGGTSYYITANEGDSRVRPATTGPFGSEGSLFNEESRVSTLSLDPSVFPNASSVKRPENLGRLLVTNRLGDTDGDGDYDALYAFGARSFSIWDSNFNLVFDSGDQLEQVTAKFNPLGFNSDGALTNAPSNPSASIGAVASFDARSDNKGPEPEGIAVATLDGRTYAFIGLERVGDVVVYDITNPASPEFKQYVNINEDVALEGLIVVSAADSPTGSALLIGANEVSKTVSVFKLFEQLPPPPPSLSIHAAAPSLAEGNIGTTSFAFSIKRSGDLAATSSVVWSVEGSGATPANAADFALSQWPTGTAVFSSGIDVVTIQVPVIGDGILEADEDFRVVLSAPVGAQIAEGQSAATSTILNDDTPAQTYSFTASPTTVYEGGILAVSVVTTNVASGTRLFWQASGTTITASDFSSGGLSGDVVIGNDGRASFTRTIAADPVVDPDEEVRLMFFRDAARNQQVGNTLSITIKEASVGVITDGNDIITGTAAGEVITGIPTGSSLRGRGSRDELTGGGGDDIFALGDSTGAYYDDGLSANRGTADLAVIRDFSVGDRIQLWGDSTKYSLVSSLNAGIRGIRIDLNPQTPGALGEAIGFVQSATLSSLNLSNTSQFLYL